MHYFIYPTKDSTIYSLYETQNTGKDEILEIEKTFVTASTIISSSISRVLLEFDTTFISQSVSDSTITSPKYYLNLQVANAENINQNNILYIYAVSESWVEGTGKKLNLPRDTSGTSWKYSDGEITSSWATSGSTYISSSEISVNLWPTQSLYNSNGKYTYNVLDLKVDVSNIVENWINNTWSNNGFLIKRNTSEENDNKNYGNLQFYSLQTHTIYSPRIEVKWDDISFNTGSLTEISASDMYVYSKNLQYEYNIESRPKIRFGVRLKYPIKTYSTSNTFETITFMSSSYYSIEDSVTGETIVSFDDYSKVSTDDVGNYINLRFDGFSPNRFYNLKLKYVSGSLQNIYNCGTFKLSK